MSTNDAPYPVPVSVTPSSPTTVAKTSTLTSIPTIAVYGCGGFGINITRSIREQIETFAKLRFIDTSRSNVTDDEEVLLIGDVGGIASGSGKFRGEHASAIHNKVSAISVDSLGVADVNIILFGLSGGSGSVAGPILMDRIAQTGNRVIVIGVADVSSQIDVTNTTRTLESMQAMAIEGGHYIQAMLFDNDVGRAKVNRIVKHRLNQLLAIEAIAAAELDRNDRRNWLNAKRMVGAAAGIRLLHVVGGEIPDDDPESGEIWSYPPDHVYDSVISIAVRDAEDVEADPIRTTIPQSIDARVRYDGIFQTLRLTPMMGLVSGDADGAAPLIAKLSARAARFASQPSVGSALIQSSTGSRGPGGLIL